MSRFVTMKDIPEGEHVVLDVPEGQLRIGGVVHPNGEAIAVFSISDEQAVAGSRPTSKPSDRTAVEIVLQTPERAETIALAFIELANKMREAITRQEYILVKDEDEEDVCCGCCDGCKFCPSADE